MGFRGLGFRGLGFRGLGFRGVGFRGLGFRYKNVGFRINQDAKYLLSTGCIGGILG